MDIKPKRRRLFMEQIASLELANQDLKSEVQDLKDLLADYRSIPDHVHRWMADFELMDRALYRCPEHDDWYVELDSLFPYHIEFNRCQQCFVALTK